jgi:long-chain acyl-CoA synthetase
VVVRRDSALESAELEGFCGKYLAAYKVPRFVEFRNELPKTTLGKTLRRVLRSTSA